MKFKRIISLLLCLAVVFTMLVGCEEKIGKYYYDVYLPEGTGVVAEKEERVYDFYVVTDRPDETDYADAASDQYGSEINTINDNINNVLKDKYKTKLNIKYVDVDNYEETVKDVASGIVLITSKAMKDYMTAGEKKQLIDLKSYLTDSQYQFGTLNVQIAGTLLESAKEYYIKADGSAVDYEKYYIPYVDTIDSHDRIAINKEIASKLSFSIDDMNKMVSMNSEQTKALLSAAEKQWKELGVSGDYEAEKVVKVVDYHLYAIPNNHVVDSYDYIAINKDIASQLFYGKTDIAKMVSLDSEETQALLAAAEANWNKLVLPVVECDNCDGCGECDACLECTCGDYSVDKVVKTFADVEYGYSDEDAAPKATWSYNVSRYPTVTADEAFSSAYGIIEGTEDPDRAMEIIYALNTDVEFRNLLQYGVANIHYEYIYSDETDDSDAVYIKPKDILYNMNILYTGDIFKAYYTEEWTEDMAANGMIQNSESKVLNSGEEN